MRTVCKEVTVEGNQSDSTQAETPEEEDLGGEEEWGEEGEEGGDDYEGEEERRLRSL